MRNSSSLSEGIDTQSGVSLLELVLLLPIFMFFVFVASDGGLHLLKKAQVSNALRSSLNGALGEPQSEALLEIFSGGESLSIRVDPQTLQDFAESIRKQLSTEMKPYLTAESTAENTRVSVSALLINVDADSGTFSFEEDYGNPIEVIAQTDSTDVETDARDKQTKEMKSYLRKQLSGGGSRGYRIPRLADNIATQSIDQQYLTNVYLDKALVVYAEVSSSCTGMNSSYLQQRWIGCYQLNEQATRVLRLPLN